MLVYLSFSIEFDFSLVFFFSKPIVRTLVDITMPWKPKCKHKEHLEQLHDTNSYRYKIVILRTTMFFSSSSIPLFFCHQIFVISHQIKRESYLPQYHGNHLKYYFQSSFLLHSYGTHFPYGYWGDILEYRCVNSSNTYKNNIRLP
jgi:hypothetical protein